MAGNLIDEDLVMTINSNIISTLLLLLFLSFHYLFNRKVIIPRIPKYKYDEDMLIEEITIAKKKREA